MKMEQEGGGEGGGVCGGINTFPVAADESHSQCFRQIEATKKQTKQKKKTLHICLFGCTRLQEHQINKQLLNSHGG